MTSFFNPPDQPTASMKEKPRRENQKACAAKNVAQGRGFHSQMNRVQEKYQASRTALQLASKLAALTPETWEGMCIMAISAGVQTQRLDYLDNIANSTKSMNLVWLYSQYASSRDLTEIQKCCQPAHKPRGLIAEALYSKPPMK